jgi:5S rRNA maturation endonuclease (ribonuclease M5)
MVDRIIATYDYTDELWALLYQVVRLEPKSFRQRRPDGRGGWIWGLGDVRRPLYHLPEVLESPIVFLPEGEKDVETLRAHGFAATTISGGAKAHWLPEHTDALRGREVILIPDNDTPGRERVARIARVLYGNVGRLVILTLDDSRAKDITDWFELGHSELELVEMLDGQGVTHG